MKFLQEMQLNWKPAGQTCYIIMEAWISEEKKNVVAVYLGGVEIFHSSVDGSEPPQGTHKPSHDKQKSDSCEKHSTFQVEGSGETAESVAVLFKTGWKQINTDWQHGFPINSTPQLNVLQEAVQGVMN